MKRRRKAITLHSIKQLWKRTGRRPVEVPLITKELVDQVTAQPREATPPHLQMTKTGSPKPTSLGYGNRLKWTAAACTALLVAAGLANLIHTIEPQKTGLTTAQTKPLTYENVQNQPAPDAQCTATDANPLYTVNCTSNTNMAPTEHEWQTAQMYSVDLAEHTNGGIVCYRGGEIADHCDEEMVTNMLLAFL